MEEEDRDVLSLLETLISLQQVAGRYLDCAKDLTRCDWNDVHEELRKAQTVEVKSENRGKNLARRAWRMVEATSSILEPGLSPFPDSLSVLNGGLAAIFCLARHSNMNRTKILASLGHMPNIIEMGRNKMSSFPLDNENHRIVKLYERFAILQQTLLRTLPVLLDVLVPGTIYFGARESLSRGQNIDQLLEKLSTCAESLRASYEALVDEMIVANYAASMSIQSQLDQLLQQQRMLHMSIDRANSKTDLLTFLADKLDFDDVGRNVATKDEAGISISRHISAGYSPQDLLQIIDVNHVQNSIDAALVVRKRTMIAQEDIEQAAKMIIAPQVKDFLTGTSPSVIVMEGRFDRSQLGKISPLSYVCATLWQALRKSQQNRPTYTHSSKLSPESERGEAGNVVLEYFCALHTADDDNLRGPQGLMRCLITQLLLTLVANEWISRSDAIDLPHLHDMEKRLLAQYNLEAICRLFLALVRLVPPGVPIYCLVDGWSVYEREEMWGSDYEVVLQAFREAADASVSGDRPIFKLLLTSPTSCRWLNDTQMIIIERSSQRHLDHSGINSSKGRLLNLTRAATAQDIKSSTGSVPQAGHVDPIKAISDRLLHFGDLPFLWPQVIRRAGSRQSSLHTIAWYLRRYADDLEILAKSNSTDDISKEQNNCGFVIKSRWRIAQEIIEAHVHLHGGETLEDTTTSSSKSHDRSSDGFDKSSDEDALNFIFADSESFLFDTQPVLSLQEKLKSFVSLQRSKTIVGALRGSALVHLENIMSSLTRRPVDHGKTRITWTCKCGRQLYDDFVELRPGAAKELETHLRSLHDIQPAEMMDGENESRQPTTQNYMSIQTWKSLLQRLLPATRNPPPRHDRTIEQDIELGLCSRNLDMSDRSHNFMLLCVPFQRWATKLHQAEICRINSDQELFRVLRHYYGTKRGISAWTRLRKVHGIDFVMFEMYKSQLVDLRDRPSLPSDGMRNQYIYEPLSSDILPPIGSNHLMHLFEHPEDAEVIPVLHQKIPKKLRVRLEACPTKGSSVGWGLHFVEGLNWLVVFIYGSTGFAISLIAALIWVAVRDDVQGAFAIAGFMIAFLLFCGGIARADIQV